MTDSRYTIQARRETPDAARRRGRLRPARCAGPGCSPRSARDGSPSRPPRSPTRSGCASRPPRRTWSSCRSRAGSRPLRADKQPDEVERIAAACAVADRALADAPARDPGRRHGGRPRAAPRVADPQRRRGGARVRRRLPLGAGGRPPARLARRPTGARDAVLLFDFGAQVEGYRSDMTRTLFVGEPTERDLAVYDLVGAGAAGGDRLASSRRSPRAPCRRAVASRTRSPGP